MIIIGRLVTLKLLHEKYFEEYHKAFSPMVRKILHLPSTATLQETCEFLSVALRDENHKLFFCIFDNEVDKIIGGVVFRSSDHPNGQLGAWMNECYWGGGRYQEALKLALQEFFKANDSVFAYVDVDNQRSLKAHQKIGFTIVKQGSFCSGCDCFKIVLNKKDFERMENA